MKYNIYEDIFNNSPINMEILDKNGIIMGINKSFINLFEIKNPNELINKFCLFDDPNISYEVKSMMKKQEIVQYESTIDKKTGELNLSYIISPIFDNNILEYYLIQVNVKEIKKYQKNLDSLDEILKTCRCADSQSRINDVLQEILKIFNVDRVWLLYPCESNIKTWNIPFEYSLKEYSYYYPSNKNIKIQPEVSELFNKILENKNDIVTYYSDDNTNFSTLSQMYIPLYSYVDKPWVLGLHQCSYKRKWIPSDKILFRKITQKLNEVLSNMLFIRNIQEQNKDLDDFSHTVAHDLKNPLGNIMGFSELLIENKLTKKEYKTYTEAINNSGNKMLRIIDSLLLLSKIRKTDIQLEPLKMEEIIKESINRITTLIKEHKVDIISVSKKWPVVMGIPSWIEEVWVNYLINAIKYGGRKIKIGYDEIDGDIINFWIRDNGIGISSENQLKLFNKFERLNQISTKGYGLGLSIVDRIIDKLDGRVGVKSELGKGSTFYFSLRKKNEY